MIKDNKRNNRTICLFGTYESKFPRTITIRDASRRNGYDVVECHFPFWELTRDKDVFFSLKSIIKSVIDLANIYLKLIVKYLQIKRHDVVIVGYNGYFDMPLAKFLARLRKKPLIFTPVFPLYETLVEDRKYISKASLKSKLIHKIDEIACALADMIIIETDEYLNYYHKEYRVPKKKFFNIPLGADESTFFPRESPNVDPNSNHFKVLFYGKFIPLQGIHYIVEAAKLLEDHKDIEFEIIGSGQLTQEIQNLSKSLDVKNMSFIPWVEYDKLPFHIQDADICLGIFGDTPKAMRGIPIKVYETLAMKKPVITGNSPAATQVFTNEENAILCEMANAQALSEAILLLKKDKDLRERIAEGGHKLYNELFSSERIKNGLSTALNVCIQKANQ